MVTYLSKVDLELVSPFIVQGNGWAGGNVTGEELSHLPPRQLVH